MGATATPLANGLARAILVGLAVLPAAEAMAQQSVADLFRQRLLEEAEASNLGAAFQSLSVFGATPGISAAVFNPDHRQGVDVTIRTAKLPLSHEFAPLFAGVRPYGELTLGYAQVNDTSDLNLVSGQQTKVDADFDTYSMLTGIGATIPLFGALGVRPMLLAGYSRIDGDGRFRGPFSGELEQAATGLLTDVHINTLLMGGAVQVLLATPLVDPIELTADVRYNHFYARNFNSSDPVLDTDDDFGVLNTRAEIDGPTPLTLFGRATRWIAFTGYTYLPGDQKDALDFDSFFEVGGGMAILDGEIVEGVSGFSLRASLIAGEDVTGWSAGLALEF